MIMGHLASTLHSYTHQYNNSIGHTENDIYKHLYIYLYIYKSTVSVKEYVRSSTGHLHVMNTLGLVFTDFYC